jgi:hypothetical protein
MFGLLFIGLGVAGAAFSFGIDTAPAGTHNLGLLQSQLMVLHASLVLSILGGIIWLRPTYRQENSETGFTVENKEGPFFAVVGGIVLGFIAYLTAGTFTEYSRSAAQREMDTFNSLPVDPNDPWANDMGMTVEDFDYPPDPVR